MSRLGQNQERTQAANRALLLEQIYRNKLCSRADLAKHSGLQPTTVTYIINDLINYKIVQEAGIMTGSKGRKSIGLSIDGEKYAVLAVRLTRRGYSIAVMNLKGEVIEEESFTNREAGNPNESIGELEANCTRLVKKSKYVFLCASLAVPGPFDAVREEIVLMTGSVVWDLKKIREVLEKSLSLPLLMTHDANAGALYQLWSNNSLPSENTVVYVSVGQGVGCGILVHGEILEGNSGFAGEIGHMSIAYDGLECSCGNKGCLERYTSSTALTSFVNEKYGLNLSFRDIVKQIKEGNEAFLEEYKQCCRYLGRGIVNIMNSFNPAVIILGDEITRVDPSLLLSLVKEEVKKHTLFQLNSVTSIVADDSGLNAELLGAGIVAIKYVFSHISSLL